MARRGSHLELYLHLVWGTFERRPLIAKVIEPDLLRLIADKSQALGCLPCAVGATDDHVHLLARLHPSISVAQLIAQVKGVSSHAMNHQLAGDQPFRWQAGYGAFTTSADDVPAVERYVLDQRRHHAIGDRDVGPLGGAAERECSASEGGLVLF